jgi:hypothetical protein
MTVDTLPRPPRRFDFLDQVRGIAILMVFGFHALGKKMATTVALP